MDRCGRLSPAILTLSLLAPSQASAQAWVPPKGEGFLSLTFQSLEAGDHLFSSPVMGERSLDLGSGESRVLVLDGDVGLTDKLGLTLSVAYVDARYTEGGRAGEIRETLPDFPHLDLPADDGDWHGSLQDARVSLRYMRPTGSWVLTPGGALLVPLRDYRTRGHAATGRGLNEAQLGLDAGRLLDVRGRPRAYLQGGYRYTFIEELAGISMNRSDLYVELGYLAHPRLTLRGFGDWRTSHGGLDFAAGDLHGGNFSHHDALEASEWLRVGVGASVPITRDADLFASVGHMIAGENIQRSTTFSAGTTWGFQAPGFGRTKIRFPEPGD